MYICQINYIDKQSLQCFAGNPETLSKFTKELEDEGVFVRNVDSSGIAFHSPDMEKVAPALKTRA